MKNSRFRNKITAGMSKSGIKSVKKPIKPVNPTFIHVPKTAGTSLRSILRDHMIIDGHAKASEYDQINFKAAFVRNPYDRFISAFWYIKNGNSGLYRKNKTKDILNIIRNYKNASDFIIDFHKYKIIQNHKHFLPQSYFLDAKMDFIGKFENLNKDSIKLFNMLGLPNVKIPSLNVNNKRDNSLTNEAARIIEQYYKKDFKMFNYKMTFKSKLNFLKPTKNNQFGSHKYYFMDDYIDTMVKLGYATSSEINEHAYYVNGKPIWPGDKCKSSDKTICMNFIPKNSVPSIYLPLKYDAYLNKINKIKRLNKNIVAWCGSNYKSTKRKNYNLTKCCDVNINDLSFEKYLDILGSTKFCLCLPGFGPKCHREIEAMGLGTVPVFTKGCCINYWNKLIKGKHYLEVETASDVYNLSNVSNTKWGKMSDHCINWFQNNVTPHGSFRVLNEIIQEKF